MLNSNTKKIIKIIKDGGVGVMPTDTLYGLVGSAFSKNAINRIYKLKKRSKSKKLIVLISAMAEIGKFGTKLTNVQSSTLNKVWPHSALATRGKPEPVSVVLNDIAFRLPAKKSLIEILKKTGPLVAPSANPKGLKPAENITQAKKYFGKVLPFGEDLGGVDFYLPGGTLKGKPSALIKIKKNGEIEVLRGNIKG